MSANESAGRPEPTFVPAEPVQPELATPPSAYAPAPAQPNPYAPSPYAASPSAPAEPDPYAAAGPDPYGSGQVVTPVSELPPERVLPGLALALLAIPAGAGLAAIIWHLGFIASISTFLLAALAAFLYRKGSGGQVRRGIPGIAAIIVVGAVVSFFAVVASDASTYYSQNADAQAYGSRASFIFSNLFYGPVLRGYAKDAALFALFAALGAFGVITRLIRSNRAH